MFIRFKNVPEPQKGHSLRPAELRIFKLEVNDNYTKVVNVVNKFNLAKLDGMKFESLNLSQKLFAQWKYPKIFKFGSVFLQL